MPDCQRCGAFVSARFVRVFGDNDDRVWACPECSDHTQLSTGAAVRPVAADGGEST